MTILVTGATGNIGRKVVDELVARGVTDIRALTTNPAKAALPDGVEAFDGFIGKPQTLDGAFAGVTAMYLAPHQPTVSEVLGRARAAGVEYVVALSGGAHWQALTDEINAAGVPVTQLGPGEFLENFAGWADQIKADHTVREPYPDAGGAPIAMADIAAVAAALLTAPDRGPHVGRMYEIAGPEFLTRPQAAAQIGVGIGEPVGFEQISRAEAEERLRTTMGDMASWYLDLQKSSIQWKQQPNRLVEQITGRPATTLAEWVAANRDLFVA